LQPTAWIRAAFWVGRCKDGEHERFVTLIQGAIVPALQVMPGVRSARALWPARRENAPPSIACQLLVEFASHDDLERMLASDERTAMRSSVSETLELFEGALSHIDFEVGPAP